MLGVLAFDVLEDTDPPDISRREKLGIGIGAACGVLLVAGCIIGAYIYGKRSAEIEPTAHTEPEAADGEQKGCGAGIPEIDGREAFRSELDSPGSRIQIYEKE